MTDRYWSKFIIIRMVGIRSSVLIGNDIRIPTVNMYLVKISFHQKLTKGHLRIKRLITKTNKLPSWGEHLFSTRNVWLIEESIVDPKNHTMSIYTRNLNLRIFMGTTEKVTLVPSENDEKSTKAIKEAWIESEIYGLRSAIKSFGIDRFKKNCDKATKGFEWVLNRTFTSDETK